MGKKDDSALLRQLIADGVGSPEQQAEWQSILDEVHPPKKKKPKKKPEEEQPTNVVDFPTKKKKTKKEKEEEPPPKTRKRAVVYFIITLCAGLYTWIVGPNQWMIVLVFFLAWSALSHLTNKDMFND